MIFVAWILAFAVGFLSLSQEILFIRLGSFMQHGIPESFAFVLGLFLLGISLGASLGKTLCTRKVNLAVWTGVILVATGIIDIATPSMAEMLFGGENFNVSFAMLILLSSSLKGVAFPVAHHLGSNVGRMELLGRSVSRVYALNIAGSTLGTLLTGYFLLDYVSLSGGFVLIGCTTLVVGTVALWSEFRSLSIAGLALATLSLGTADLNDHDMVIAASGTFKEFVGTVIENRHGIIHTVNGRSMGDAVYGGNVYDGRTNIDLRINTNMIDRVYLVAGLHPAPRRILVIGLSSGAWTRVLSAIPGVERIDVVEINPGYLELIPRYPKLAPLLHDQRIRIHIDDGRRWLRRNPSEMYDLVVMNTTWHWRANSTNLLSRQFMEIVRAHLNPGAVLAFNTTSSDDAIATAAEVFPVVSKWSNFAYASDRDLAATPGNQRLSRLSQLELDGRLLFNLDSVADRTALNKLAAARLIGIEEIRKQASRKLETITDTNMITEFKYGKHMKFD